MKPLFAALSVAFLLGTTVNVHAAEQVKPTDRSVQVYKKADLAEWNRENAAGGKGPLLGRFAFNRHQTTAQDAFREIGWLTLPPGASIGEHKHTDNEDVYIIVSGKACLPTARVNKPKSAPATSPSPAPVSPMR